MKHQLGIAQKIIHSQHQTGKHGSEPEQANETPEPQVEPLFPGGPQGQGTKEQKAGGDDDR